MRMVIGISSAILIAAGSLWAATGDGGYAAPFLQLPIGARPTAMGGAYLGISDDAAGALFNPAGLSSLQKNLFGTSYRAMKLDRKLGYATALFPVRGQAVLGVHWLYAGSGAVPARDADGALMGYDFSLNSHVFGIVFAKRFSDVVSLGTKMNYLVSTMPKVTATSIGFDFGAMFHLSQLINREKRDKWAVQDIQAGVTIKNIAAQYRWNSEKLVRAYYPDQQYSFQQDDRVPIEAGLGVSARFLKRKLMLASDLRKSEFQHLRFYGGAEYFVSPQFMLRSGMADKRFTAGAGFVFKIGTKALAIDYAFSNDRVDEGADHIFSFDLLF